MNKYLVFGCIVLVVFLAVLGMAYYDSIQENNRLSKNIEQLMSIGNKSIYMTKDEMRSYLDQRDDSLLEKISAQAGMTVRPNNVTEVENIHYTYGDTTIVEMPIFQVDNLYPFDYKDSCWSAKGYFNLDDSKLVFQERGSAVDITKVDFSKREKKMKWLFGGIRIGKKKAYIETVNSCGGDVKVFEIEVE